MQHDVPCIGTLFHQISNYKKTHLQERFQLRYGISKILMKNKVTEKAHFMNEIINIEH